MIMPKPLTPLALGSNVTNQADEQRAMVRSMLKEAIAILRDDKPFDPEHSVFGRMYAAKPHLPAEGKLYRYANNTLPNARIEVSTGDDPDDFNDDRSKVKIVPGGVTIRLDPLLAGLSDVEIKSLLQLEDYWVDADGKREYGNEIKIRTPDAPNEQTFRYRSKDIPGSKFPVNVNLAFANPLDRSFPQMLAEVRLSRAYRILTPEEREQRRREQQQAKRQKYGEMNLRTGMLCPESGFWQGFTESGQPDVTMIWKGQQFPQVRTLTHQEEREQRRSTKWIDGQWMWVEENKGASRG
ncbi:hypothetical protein [Burkholderia stagnalis]|uniref:hypothetical protein n=1 Tax=Burkholderia stagnalis TaxID=1503054 RepID=UPI001F49826B|nr:hypothetical protein [Burkholderia stagnalis]